MKVSTGKLLVPPRIYLHGTPGVGKTHAAAQANAPLFMDFNQGSKQENVSRLELPTDFNGLLSSLKEVATEDHAFKTLVLDTMGDIEQLIIWPAVLADANKTARVKMSHINEIGGGWNKGQEAAVDYWRRLIVALEAVWARGMTIILIDHSVAKNFKNPIGEDYQRYEPRVDKKASTLLCAWCDAVLMADFGVEIAKDPQTKRVRANASGNRVLRCVWDAGWEAKNRYGLPEEMPLDWTALSTAIAAGMQDKKEAA